MPVVDPFSVLNVPLDADEATIERAWKDAVLAAHPDRFVDAAPEVRAAQEELTRLLNDAFATLMDPVRRADATLEHQRIYGIHRQLKPNASVPPPASGATEPPPPRPLEVEVPQLDPDPPPRRRLFNGRRSRRNHD